MALSVPLSKYGNISQRRVVSVLAMLSCGDCTFPVCPPPCSLLQDKDVEDDWRPIMMIKFVLLRSPLAALHDPETVILCQMLSAKPSLSEIMWNFSRYKDRARITLEQNPHFFSTLPADESVYTPMFKCHPLRDLSVALKPHDTVYVLVDRPGGVILRTERERLRFGNVWILNGNLIFKDRTGVLKGEQLFEDTSIGGNWRRYVQLLALPDCDCRSQLNHRHLQPIITPSSNPASWTPFDDRTVLNHPPSYPINIYIYSAQSHPGSSDLHLPPPPPTSERPEYQVVYSNIDTLKDDILLFIFNYYRLVDQTHWNNRLEWCKLAHVCRRWRYIIFGSALHLDMSLSCTNGSPVVDMLAHFPPLPLIIDYRYSAIDPLDEMGMSHAILLRDRVCHVDLYIPHSSLQQLLALMDEPFPSLRHVSLSESSTGDEDTSLILPENFLAPNLRHLTLSGVDLPRELTLLSTASLVTLTLTNIQASGYFLPKHLVVALFQSSPHLEELSIGFSTPLPRPSAERELFNALETPVMLPSLKRLMFRGVSAYLESLVAQIRAPLLQLFDITLFNQAAFILPHLSHFIHATQELKLPTGKIVFNRDSVSLTNCRSGEGSETPSFSLRVMCKPFDWQLDSVAQICSMLMPVLSYIEELTLDIDGQEMPTEWQDGAVDGAAWLELLRPFVGANRLCLHQTVVQEISCALQPEHVGLDPELLPALQVLVWHLEMGNIANAFASFVDARRIADRPVVTQSSQLARTRKSQPSSPSRNYFPFDTSLSSFSDLIYVYFTLDSLSYADLHPQPEDRYLPVPYVPLGWVEPDPPPPRTVKSGWRPLKIQPPSSKHIRSRIRPSHKGAGSAWR